MYVAWQYALSQNADGSKHICYALNRSTDGGTTWILNGFNGGDCVASGSQSHDLADCDRQISVLLDRLIAPAAGIVLTLAGELHRFAELVPQKTGATYRRRTETSLTRATPFE